MPIWDDPSISAKAKGVWAYMRSRPHGWDFSALRIAQAMKDGRNAVLGAMKELEVAGYLFRERLKSRRVVYTLCSKPNQVPFTVRIEKGHFPEPKNVDYVERGGRVNPTLKQAVEYVSLAYSSYGHISPLVIENMLTRRAKWGSYSDLNEWMEDNRGLLGSYFGLSETDEF